MFNDSICKDCIYSSYSKHFLTSSGFRKCDIKVNRIDISQGRIVIDGKNDAIYTRGVLECAKFKSV